MVKSLIIDYSKISICPDLSSLTGLTSLRINRTDLKIAPDVRGLTSLKFLNLCENKIITVPDICNLPFLKVINIACNEIVLPPKMANLPSISTLILGNNYLESAPELSLLPSLQRIDLNANYIENPPDLSKNTLLRSLHLSQNYIVEPPDVSTLVNLESFYICYNQLTVAPNVTGLTKLNVLYISDNQIATPLPNYIVEDIEHYGHENNLYNRYQPETTTIFNSPQSTHNESVHKSVSESAGRLQVRYKSFIDTEEKIASIAKKMISCISNLKEGFLKQAVKEFGETNVNIKNTILEVIFRLSVKSKIDYRSGVQVREMLALGWVAIHDNSKRLGTVEDAMKMFVNGLYQIQRGYNINSLGQDDGNDAIVICLGGTFNKLVEILNSIHPDVEIRFLTNKTATIKLQAVVKEETTRYFGSV